MKLHNKILAVLAVLTLGVSFTGCKSIKEEITELGLTRCLAPLNLKATISQGNIVTFKWDVASDATAYNLEVYTDKEMTEANREIQVTLEPEDIPFTKALTADATYYYKVQAVNTEKNLKDSKWSVYSKAINTYAVKDNLFPAISARTSSSISFTWSKEISDYTDIDRIEYCKQGEEAGDPYTLTSDDIANATATVSGLSASTEYVFTLYYKSASRGEINAWTLPDVSGATAVKSVTELKQAITDKAPAILLQMAGSPYTIKDLVLTGDLDIASTVKIYGEVAADGSMPVVNGQFNIVKDYVNGPILFEGVELNGLNDTYGFPIQLKESGGIGTTGMPVESITFRNCVIKGYSKGLFYEWSQAIDLGSLDFESCEICEINESGSGGGDVIDIRGTMSSPLSKIGDINITNCTIYNGGRTFLRIDFPQSLGNIKFNGNTIMNICVSDNANNAGIIALQTKPVSIEFKNNLLLNMGSLAKLVSASASSSSTKDYDGFKYIGTSGISCANNWFWNCPEDTFFNANGKLADAGTALGEDPCYNAKGGMFNLKDSEVGNELTEKKVGASKWWTKYVEEPEVINYTVNSTNKTWSLDNAKYFAGTISKEMVRDNLYINATEDNSITVSDGVLNFKAETVTDKKGVPTVGYIAFLVDKPGSVIVKAEDPNNACKHIIIGVGPKDRSSVTVKGGVAYMSDMDNASKILVKDITEESLVYVYVSGPVGLSKLAWSTDVTPVNTALPTPVPTASPASFTAGEATDVVISWNPVANAGSYSAVFNGKTFAVEDGETSFTLGGTTTGMLDKGSYIVDIYANPGEDDIYNTMSEAGAASFAVLPKSGDDGDSEFVVKSVDELKAAIDAGKTEISVAPGTYALTEPLVAPANLILKNQTGAERPQITGSIKIKGQDLGDIVFEGLELIGDATNSNCFTVSNPTGDAATENVSATSVIIRNCLIRDYSKSIWYNPKGNKSTAESAIGSLRIENNIIKNCTTGQNTIDIRDGHYDEVKLEHNTFDGCAQSGADLIRIDDTQNGVVEIPTFIVSNNTFSNCANASGKALLYVREAFGSFNFANNLVLCADGSLGQLSRLAVVKPSLKNNFYYNPGANFFTGDITTDGATLTTSPVKDAANGDFTLTSSLVISSNAGARRWNPNYTETSSSSVSVKDVDELTAAIAAGKTSISLAAGDYVLSSPMTCVAGLQMSGASSTDRPVITGSFKIAGENNGNIVFENIVFQGDATNSNCFTVSNKTGDAAADFVSAKTVSFRNCQFKDYSKSVWYNPKGNKSTAESEISAVLFEGCRFTNCTTGQNTIDIRDGKYTSFTVSNSTFESCAVSGADLIRVDNGQNGVVELDGLVIKNNTFYNCASASGKAILYMREDVNNYIFQNNVVIGTDASAGKLSRARVALGTGFIEPTLGNNFYFSTGANFFTEDITADGTVLTSSPVKNAAGGDYTLTSALVISCNAGARCWNPTSGTRTNPSDFFSVSSKDEFDAAVSAGKTNITLKVNAEGYALSAFTPVEGMNLKGEVKNGKKPVITGSFKIAGTVGNLTFENLEIAGDATNSNCFTVSNPTGDAAAANVKGGNILIRNCDIHDYSKSVWYNPKGNKTTPESEFTSVKFTGCTIKDCTTGQNTIDIRDGAYGSFTVEKSTFLNCAVSNADLFRVDYTQNGLVEMGSMTIMDNTFYNCAAASGKALLYNRAPFGVYTVSGNLIMGTASHAGLLARARVALGDGYNAPELSGNCFYSIGTNMFGTSDDIQSGYGDILTDDPCTDAANGNFKLKSAIAAGDPRWR